MLGPGLKPSPGDKEQKHSDRRDANRFHEMVRGCIGDVLMAGVSHGKTGCNKSAEECKGSGHRRFGLRGLVWARDCLRLGLPYLEMRNQCRRPQPFVPLRVLQALLRAREN